VDKANCQIEKQAQTHWRRALTSPGPPLSIPQQDVFPHCICRQHGSTLHFWVLPLTLSTMDCSTASGVLLSLELRAEGSRKTSCTGEFSWPFTCSRELLAMAAGARADTQEREGDLSRGATSAAG